MSHRCKIYLVCCMLFLFSTSVFCLPALATNSGNNSIITGTGLDIPMEDGQPEGYSFPTGYQENAIQFVTEDGVTLRGYIFGAGEKGITIAHARGWMLKSVLPLAKQLADSGYQVIIWEFRGTLPSQSAEDEAAARWDLDVLAAAQVLRERGATQILPIGASYGGTSTVVAAAEIPELVGLVVLSAPAHDVEPLTPIDAISRITTPAFFAVSKRDWQGAPGIYQAEVESLYDACASEAKEFHLMEGQAHGTDMVTIPSEPTGYATVPKTDEEKSGREKLAGELMRFVNDAFEHASNGMEQESTEASSQQTPNEQQSALVEPSISGTIGEHNELPAETSPISIAHALLMISCVVVCIITIVLYGKKGKR